MEPTPPWTTFLLVRHGTNDWVGKRLAGWTPGVGLNEEGRRQARALARRLAQTPLTALYTSPLERTLETARILAEPHPHLEVRVDVRLAEVRYGTWEGKDLEVLRQDPGWPAVRHTPSLARFPEGESFREVQARAVGALEGWATAYPGGTLLIVTHADVVKLLVAYYLGLPLDLYSRLPVAPASLTVLQRGPGGARIERLNDTAHLGDPWDREAEP